VPYIVIIHSIKRQRWLEAICMLDEQVCQLGFDAFFDADQDVSITFASRLQCRSSNELS
jgi:hypothetical protein